MQLTGDKGYSFGPVRRGARQRHIRANLPKRAGQHPRRARFSTRAYRQRNIIERVIGWLKERRRIGTRYEKLALNYLAMVHIALLSIELRHRYPSDRT